VSVTDRGAEGPSLPLPQPFADLYSRSEIGLEEYEREQFRSAVLDYYRRYGRQFPWRKTHDPYRILLSEMMLQQTQTERVLPKYTEFISRWPTFHALDRAPFPEVLSCWRGLGYNRRAIALKRIAAISVTTYGGTLPENRDQLLELPMVGPATAAAVQLFCWNIPALYLETNIRRVLIYFFFHEAQKVRDRDLYTVLEALQDYADPASWYYALMDYGVFLKKLAFNPNRRSAHYARQPAFADSNRRIRGSILALMTETDCIGAEELERKLPFEAGRIRFCLERLEEEGFVQQECAGVGEGNTEYRLRRF
jgi:A/G-specific adenine glycosylase